MSAILLGAALALSIDLAGNPASGVLISPAEAKGKGKALGVGQQGHERRDQQREPREEQRDQQGDRLEGQQGPEQGHNQGKNGGKQGESEERKPPQTVKEMFERMFKPAGQPNGAATGSGSIGVIGNKLYSSTEVLAVNLSPAATKKALGLGFSLAASPSSAMTTLLAPLGMDAAQARDLLQRTLPQEEFALNRLYRVHRVANSDSDGRAQRIEPANAIGDAVPCTADHCAGRELIGWKDQLLGCSRGLSVGVIDTGIDLEHPAFANNKMRIGSFLPEGRPSAPTWHGTAVVALLAGHRKSGTPGLIPRADFYVASVFFADSTGDFATDTVSIIKALDWMDAFNVKVVNMSFTGPRDELVEKAIATLRAKGTMFIAAAGNEGPTAGPSYPAAYKQVIAVTAVSKESRNYPYANRGAHIDVAAPGVNIWTAVPGSREGYYSGTSFAAPHVTAIVATIYDGGQRHSKDALLDRLQVRDLGPVGRDPIYGRGLLMAPASCRLDATTALAGQ